MSSDNSTNQRRLPIDENFAGEMQTLSCRQVNFPTTYIKRPQRLIKSQWMSAFAVDVESQFIAVGCALVSVSSRVIAVDRHEFTSLQGKPCSHIRLPYVLLI